MKKILLVFALLGALFGVAQTNSDFPVSGIVLGVDQEPVPYAAVAVYNSADSSLVTGGASNEIGRFSIPLPKGDYYLKISFLAFADEFVSDVKVENTPVKLGSLTLKPKSQKLNEFVVEAESNTMEFKLDKRVINVGKNIANRGSNTQDILDNIPSVDVDVDGNVSLRGSNKVRILIDGKPSGLVGMSSQDALRQLPGDLVEKVEIITNPSAKYDAEGETGIINIVLKKEKKKGLNGVFTFTTGIPENHGASYSINLRKKKFNLFSSFGLTYNKFPGNGNSYQEFVRDGLTYAYERDREHTRGGLGGNFRLGSEFFLNEKNTLTISGMYKNATGDNTAVLTYDDYDPTGDLIQTVVRDEEETEKKVNTEVSVDYRKTFDRKDQEWTTSFKYFKTVDLEESNLVETNTFPNTLDIDQLTDNVENEDNMLFQTDYTLPFNEEGKFELGGKGSFRNLNNKYKVQQQIGDGDWFTLPQFDNNMLYRENIYAGYAILSNELKKKFGYQLGLRAEYSDIGTELVKTNDVNNRKYFNLFPSAHLSYNFNEFKSVQLSYSRRINRPGFWHLLPFFGFNDSRNFFSGNPDLNPEYINSFEAGYMVQNEKASLLTSVYYRHNTDVIERITISDSIGFTSIIPVNIGVKDAYGVELSGNYTIAKWWKLNGSLNFAQEIVDGEYRGDEYNSNTLALIGKVNSNFKITKDFNVQLSGNYFSPRNSTQGKVFARYRIDLGAALDVQKGKGTISLSGRDIFNTNKRRYEIFGENFYTVGEFQWRSRRIVLTYSYRLNQKKQHGRGGGHGGYGG